MQSFLWVEKYRPKTVTDTILPPKLKLAFEAVIKSGEFQHMLFTGTAGLGKTTVAKALCNQLGLDYIVINGSDERNIETLRSKVKQFASSVSLGGNYKVVILDEADYLNPNSFQPALRGFMEEFADNCRFILTCNYKNRLIEPLHSRCAVYEFNTTKKELVGLASQFHNRVKEILKDEGVEFQEKVVADVIMRYAPDWRRILNELQRSAVSGEISDGTVTSTATKFDDLFKHLKAKDFRKMRQWVVNNIDAETTSIVRGIYDEMFDYVKPTSIPQLIIILGDCQYKAAFVADHEINLVSALTEILTDVEFK